MPQSEHNLIWLDLEMTGLNPEQDRIIEIATVITDGQLNLLAEGPVLALNQPESVLAAMNDWNMDQHTRSGLLQRVRSSAYAEADAEKFTLEFLQQYLPAGISPMCRQHDLPGPPLPQTLHARTRGIFSLPQPGREHGKGTG